MYNEQWKTVTGRFDDIDQFLYAAAISRYEKYAKVAQIGVDFGRSLISVLPIAKTLGYKQVVAVDTFEDINARTEFENNIQKLECGDMVHVIQEEPTSASTYFPELYFDVVFINIGYDYNIVKTTIDTWLPKVKLGGTLMGYGWFSGEVQSAVASSISSYGPQHVCENVWWYFKE